MDKEKGRSSEGVLKGGSKPGIRARGKEMGTQGGGELKEWWPSDQKQEGPPDPAPAWEQRTKVIQAQIQPVNQEDNAPCEAGIAMSS